MERVCYILGAGFSAPLGLPVMSNFLTKAKDLYFLEPDQYTHFTEIFDRIREMHVSKTYYNVDLLNIEEILSILEMRSFLQEEESQKAFVRFIGDVISGCMPSIKPAQLPTSEWQKHLFGKAGTDWTGYGFFVATVLGLKVMGTRSGSAVHARASYNEAPTSHYSIISLNYDLVLERVLTFVTSNYAPMDKLCFDTGKAPEDSGKANLAKLHGSVDEGSIVPPTWRKGGSRQIVRAWNLAHACLAQANHIRFLGYSLPSSDSYVRYLLKSAVLDSSHLKSIDVICLDPSGEVRERYDEFIVFRDYRFLDRPIEGYLNGIAAKTATRQGRQNETVAFFDGLEQTHDAFVKEASESSG